MRVWRIATLIGMVATSGAVRAADGPYPKGLPRTPDSFPMAVWLQSPANAERYRAIGINTYVGLWRGPTEEQLDALDKAGIRLICGQNERSLRFKDRPDDRRLDARRRARQRPVARAGEGLRAADPAGNGSSRVTDKIRQADPDRPVMLNLGQGVAWDGWYGRGVRTNHPEDYPEYLKGCDIASFDIYPASHEKTEIAGNLWYVPQGVDRLRRWTEGRKDVWCCIETTRIDNADRKPTPQQVRSEVWMALIHGARGIIYFAHQFKPKFIEAGLLADEEMARGVAAINRQVRELAPVLNSPDVTDGATVASSEERVPIDFVVKRHAGRTYLFAVAMREGETTATFTLAGHGRCPGRGAGRGPDDRGRRRQVGGPLHGLSGPPLPDPAGPIGVRPPGLHLPDPDRFQRRVIRDPPHAIPRRVVRRSAPSARPPPPPRGTSRPGRRRPRVRAS